MRLAWIAEHDILPGQFKQHRVIEELVDGHIFREAFPAPIHREWFFKTDSIQL
jgi:hypothetical protein